MNDSEEKEIDPLSIIGKHCLTKAAVKIESIFIGQKISLQVKLYEALIEENKSKSNNKLIRPIADPIVKEESKDSESNSENEESDNEESDVSEFDSD